MPTVETRTESTTATAPAGEATDDEDAALAGDASGSDSAPDGEQADYRQRYLDERRERQRLARRLTETRQAAAAAPDLESRASTAERERDEAREELRRERTFGRLSAEATRQGAVDPEVVASLLVASDDLEVEDDGRVKNVTEAVKDLLRRKPYLTTKAGGSPPTGDAGAGRGAAGDNKPDFNSAFRRLANK